MLATELSLNITLGVEIDCCLDQKVTRFIQERLDRQLKQSEFENFFNNLLQVNQSNKRRQQLVFDKIITDMYGNYILQKLLL